VVVGVEAARFMGRLPVGCGWPAGGTCAMWNVSLHEVAAGGMMYVVVCPTKMPCWRFRGQASICTYHLPYMTGNCLGLPCIVLDDAA
jgi:hypothetical protein